MTRTAVVVPGHHGPERLADLVRAAERIVVETNADVVVFTGWSPRGGPSEAEQMREAWRGPGVELVVEPTASSPPRTRRARSRCCSSAASSAPSSSARRCTCYRTRFFFSRLYGAHGIESEFRVARVAPRRARSRGSSARCRCCRRQLRAAQAELAQVVDA